MTDLTAFVYHDSIRYDLPISPQLQSYWSYFITLVREEISAKAGSTPDFPIASVDLEIAGDSWRVQAGEGG